MAAGVPAQWVVGDTVYGAEELRVWIEAQQKNFVLAVPETHQVWVQGRAQAVGLLAALLPNDAWVVLSAGEGSKGLRLYEWAWLQLPNETEYAWFIHDDKDYSGSQRNVAFLNSIGREAFYRTLFEESK